MEGFLSSAFRRLLPVTVLLSLCGLLPFSTACNDTYCRLPECACPSTDIPLGLDRVEVPQMVILMFDGRVDKAAEKLAREICSSDLQNPNECSISCTFFVSNENTDYCAVNRLWAEGHDIGVNGITRHTENFWQEAPADVWDSEVERQVENLQKNAGINHFSLYGWRTPHLVAGADIQFDTLNAGTYQFLYDATLNTPEVKSSDNTTLFYWPFTLDYPYTTAFPQYSYKQPKRSHKGLWELPVQALHDGKVPCRYLNACPRLRRQPEETYQLLHENFDRHYKSNRAPFTINVVARWLIDNDVAARGLSSFLVDMVKAEDVWVVSGKQAIDWVRTPRNLGTLDAFGPWGCFARSYKSGCTPSKLGNRTSELFPGLFGPGGNYNLLIFQYISLTIIFIIAYRYDKYRKS